MKAYNGYRSWNSWNVCLWINNVESMYKHALQCIEIAIKRYQKILDEHGLTATLKANICRVAAYQFMLDVPPGEKTPDGAVYTNIAVKTVMSEILEGMGINNA